MRRIKVNIELFVPATVTPGIASDFGYTVWSKDNIALYAEYPSIQLALLPSTDYAKTLIYGTNGKWYISTTDISEFHKLFAGDEVVKCDVDNTVAVWGGVTNTLGLWPAYLNKSAYMPPVDGTSVPASGNPGSYNIQAILTAKSSEGGLNGSLYTDSLYGPLVNQWYE